LTVDFPKRRFAILATFSLIFLCQMQPNAATKLCWHHTVLATPGSSQIKRIGVACRSFVDCLETLEKVGIHRSKRSFKPGDSTALHQDDSGARPAIFARSDASRARRQDTWKDGGDVIS